MPYLLVLTYFLTWWGFSPSVMNIIIQLLWQVFKLWMVVMGENIQKYFTLLGEHALSNRLDGPPSFTPCNQANTSVVWQDLLWHEDREVVRSHFPVRLLVFDCHLRMGLRGCHRAAFLEVTYFFHLAVTPHPTSKAVCAKLCMCLVALEYRPQSFHRMEANPWSWAGPL